ncbi:MAG: RidA family protein [Hyphomonadaceae bacterium]|nr:RidA family protein [Hyphomonadaceae bacterium]
MTSPAPLEADTLPRALLPVGWPTPRGYANGMLAQGRLVVTGGLVGWNAAGEFPATFVEQARQTFVNIVAVLKAGGAHPEHLVRLTWYLVDIEEYLAEQKALGAAYRETIGAHYPAMAVMQVVRLVEPAARIEIEATAVIPDRRR